MNNYTPSFLLGLAAYRHVPTGSASILQSIVAVQALQKAHIGGMPAFLRPVLDHPEFLHRCLIPSIPAGFSPLHNILPRVDIEANWNEDDELEGVE